ncbi:MAG: 2'-deoxycytidine 5'-triphosphate deaminase [Actinobacteria bacterium]|nr:MAG: 2'-deoxycytidine 5'-triphosphate deaminase [Actinomycetota bacterium]
MLRDLPAGARGVLPSQLIRRAIDLGYVEADGGKIPDDRVQPASLDLRLGTRAYRLRCSFLPGSEAVERKMRPLVIDELDLRDGAVLEPNRPYLIPLMERLALPEGVRGKTNPKSSTGRLDVFTRVVTDRSYRFDEIADGYNGRLYLEVVPLSFAVAVEEGLSLNQLRLVVGRAPLTDAELLEEHRANPLLFRGGQAVAPHDLALADGLFLSLDLRGDKRGNVGYRAKLNTPGLDMASVGTHRVDDYWERVTSEERARIVLDPERFYLLLSEESVRVPPGLAAEMTAFDPTSGELRTHYAGFFDPGFGYSRDGQLHGTRAALEVRAHDVPFMIEQGQGVCKLTFERMLAEPDELYGDDVGSNYQGQAQTLSKHFRVTKSLAAEPPQMELFGGDS